VGSCVVQHPPSDKSSDREYNAPFWYESVHHEGGRTAPEHGHALPIGVAMDQLRLGGNHRPCLLPRAGTLFAPNDVVE